jgi:hypothetical protein
MNSGDIGWFHPREEGHIEIPIMGKALVTALIENMADLVLVDEGVIAPERIRRIEVQDALVDTIEVY